MGRGGDRCPPGRCVSRDQEAEGTVIGSRWDRLCTVLPRSQKHSGMFCVWCFFYLGGGIEACNLVFGLFSFKLGSGTLFFIFFYHCTTHFGGNSPPFVQNRPFLPSSFSCSKAHSFANPKPSLPPRFYCVTLGSPEEGVFSS